MLMNNVGRVIGFKASFKQPRRANVVSRQLVKPLPVRPSHTRRPSENENARL